MEANELRIGNYVCFAQTGATFKVDSVSATGLGVSNRSEEVWIELETFEPITLTEEWLPKLGFKSYDANWSNKGLLWISKYDFVICIGNELEQVNIRLKLKHVHELQNLDHSLNPKHG